MQRICAQSRAQVTPDCVSPRLPAGVALPLQCPRGAETGPGSHGKPHPLDRSCCLPVSVDLLLQPRVSSERQAEARPDGGKHEPVTGLPVHPEAPKLSGGDSPVLLPEANAVTGWGSAFQAQGQCAWGCPYMWILALVCTKDGIDNAAITKKLPRVSPSLRVLRVILCEQGLSSRSHWLTKSQLLRRISSC